MILTGSLEEYEYYLTQLKRMFDGNSKLNVNNKIITMPVIISGIMNAQKLGDSGLILEYAEYLEALSAKNGLTEVIQDDYQTMNGFLYNKRVEQYLHKAITEDLFEIYYQPVLLYTEKMLYHTGSAKSPSASGAWLDRTRCIYSDCRKKSYDRTDHRSTV